jgi:hypothetical protein
MRLPKFTYKTPGFGITRNTYMTVLAAQAALPSIVQIIHPKGRPASATLPPDSPLEGFGVPLMAGADKDALNQPLMRGAYAVSDRDRKTVLRMLVLSKEEAGFDPAPFLRSSLAADLHPETVARVSATWTLMQLTFESHDPMVYDSLRFMLAVCARIGELTGGVIADPIAQTYKMPLEVFHIPQADPKVDARDFVQVFAMPRDGAFWLSTRGMQKFNLAELEMFGVGAGYVEAGRSLMITLCQQALLGNFYSLNDRVGDRSCPLQIGAGGLDRGTWEGILCHELLPPTKRTVDEAIAAWKASL